MSGSPTPAAGMPLHAVWWSVLKPGLLTLPNGQPGYEMVYQTETLAEATAQVRTIAGGCIVANVVVFVNPGAPVPASKVFRPQ